MAHGRARAAVAGGGAGWLSPRCCPRAGQRAGYVKVSGIGPSSAESKGGEAAAAAPRSSKREKKEQRAGDGKVQGCGRVRARELFPKCVFYVSRNFEPDFLGKPSVFVCGKTHHPLFSF